VITQSGLIVTVPVGLGGGSASMSDTQQEVVTKVRPGGLPPGERGEVIICEKARCAEEGSGLSPGGVVQRMQNLSRGSFKDSIYRSLRDRLPVADVVGAGRRGKASMNGADRVAAGDSRHPRAWTSLDELPALLGGRYQFGGYGVIVVEHPPEAKDDRLAPEAGEHSGGIFRGVSSNRFGSWLDRRGGKKGLSGVVGIEKHGGTHHESIGTKPPEDSGEGGILSHKAPGTVSIPEPGAEPGQEWLGDEHDASAG
jgi:hypothetical protein